MSFNPEPAITVKNLGKRYILYDQPQDRLKHMLFWRFGRHYGHLFWALKGVNFEIQKGETFGIIGKNGSGKSTLLQILAGTLEQSEGTAEVHGKVSALLELGAGFNPEFSGRENVYLYGNILGISSDEMKHRFDEIAAFADIGEFIEQPVKIYSSGMFVRLAFAVAAGVDADVLLIDEALAVGDIFFRQKCYQRLEHLRRKGTTILLVSHAMGEVEQFCDRAALLNEGKLDFLGQAAEAVKRYYLVEQTDREQAFATEIESAGGEPGGFEAENHSGEVKWPSSQAFLDISNKPQASNGWAKFTAAAVCNKAGQPCLSFEQGETASFYYEIEVLKDIEVPIGGVEFTNEKGIIVHGKNGLQYDQELPPFVRKGTRLRFRQDFCLDLMIGEYTFTLGFSTISKTDFEHRALFSHPDLDSRMIHVNLLVNAGYFAVVFARNARPVQLPHHGIADLPGSSWIEVLND